MNLVMQGQLLDSVSRPASRIEPLLIGASDAKKSSFACLGAKASPHAYLSISHGVMYENVVGV